MANHSLPTLTSTYTNFVSELDGRLDDLAVGLDPAVTTATNVPTNSIRWSSASNLWQKFNGTSWVNLTTTYAIAISGNAGTATTLATARTINGVSFNGSANISVNLNNSVTFNNGGAGAASGSTFNGSGALTVSYNTVGAPSTTGTNASGSWGINITGNAATATSATSATAATNLAGGSTGTLPYQSAAGTTAQLAAGTSGQVLRSNGAAAPSWVELDMTYMPGAAFKKAVRVATTANITLSGTQTIDGIAAVAGDRVLVKNQTTASQNGIYIVAAGAWTRAPDADTSAEIGAAFVAVDVGTANGGELWTTNFKATGTLGTTAMSWFELIYNSGTWDINTNGSAATLTTARTLTIGSTGKTFNGSANVSWTVGEIGAVPSTGTTGAATVPAGTTAQRPTAATGQFRFNTTLGKFEGYNGAAWGAVGGGATGGGSDDIFVENGQTVTTNYTITTGKNAMSAGPITISSGITVTIPSGSTWVVV